MLRVLGIDPGLATMGYGVIDSDGHRHVCVEYGAVTTPAGQAFPARLVDVYDGVTYLMDKFKPDAVAIEELFFNKNVKTAIEVAQARGVALIAAARKTTELYEYTPLQVKQALVGYGRADKNQIQQMVRVMLGFTSAPKPDDASDALAVAICHVHSRKLCPAAIK